MGQYPELAGVWRPVCRMQWTDHASSGPRQWNGTYEERWDADGRCTYKYPHSGARGGGVVVGMAGRLPSSPAAAAACSADRSENGAWWVISSYMSIAKEYTSALAEYGS